jgi:CHAT domain-containing protein
LSLVNPQPGTLQTLPFSEWEGRQLRGRSGRAAGRFYAGAEAVWAQTDGWDGAAVLHFSCHGFGHPNFSPLSHLVLHDDLLLGHDVVYRRPPLREGSLVILNGCQTGERDWRAVDEGMGLMNAFLLRGASLVLASQWSVVDACAADMVLTFTDQFLHQGKTAPEALRAAQQSLHQLTTDQILERCAEVLAEFPDEAAPLEAAKIAVTGLRVCKRANRFDEARAWADRAAACCQRAGLPAEAERLMEIVRSPVAQQVWRGPAGFDHPVFWGAFQLIGRVT